MSIKKIALSIAFAGVILAGCRKGYLDINNNPNSATEASVTPNRALAAQLVSTANRNASSYDFLQRWLGYWSASGGYSRSTTEMSYNITNDFAAGLWNGMFYESGQYKSIENKANSLGWTMYAGIARGMRAINMANLVDIYNNVPYSKALDLAGNVRPDYDNGEDVYKGVMAELDSSIAIVKAADLSANPDISTQDVVFQGDQTKWVKFFNTAKLRLLIHTSEVTTFNVATEIAKMTDGFLGAGQSANAQPGYTAEKLNPFWGAHILSAAGQEADNYNRANQTTVLLMRALNDTFRLKAFYQIPKSLFTGGAVPQNSNSIRGTLYGSDPIVENGGDFTSGPGRGIVKAATGPMWIMTSVESLFLQAEAVARGWLPGDAKAAYEAAVKESFTYLGLTTANATQYLAGNDPKVAWPAAPTLASMLNVIIWQKYFALNGIQANETWVDYRRLNILTVPLSIAPERQGNPIPVRLLYPSAEYSYNKSAVNAQGAISPFTSKVFWDK